MKNLFGLGCIIFIVCIAFFAASSASAAAEEAITGERAFVVISGKSPDMLFLDTHGFKMLDRNRIEVPKNPEIYDLDGAAINLAALKIPCEGYLEYKKKGNGVPQLFRLEVKGYVVDEPSNKFTQEAKQKELPR